MLGLLFTILPGLDGLGPAAREGGARQGRTATSDEIATYEVGTADGHGAACRRLVRGGCVAAVGIGNSSPLDGVFPSRAEIRVFWRLKWQ